MKKILFIFIGIAILFTSCSDDDSSGRLVSTIETLNIFGGGAVFQQIKTEYSNGKITKVKSLLPDTNGPKHYSDRLYNNNGLLSTINYYEHNILASSTDYSYDSQGRMTKVHFTYDEEGINTTTTFTYNNDNTITSNTQGSSVGEIIFYLNNNNLIYKQVSSNNTYEVVYDGYTPASLLNNGMVATYYYDNEHDPSLLNINSGLGDFKPNAVLQLNSLPGAALSNSDKYLIYFGGIKYVYTFNKNGLPTKMVIYEGDWIRSQTEYFYD